MSARQTVLLVGGTGRTGGRVLAQLLDRGVAVRAIVRSRSRLPEGVADHSDLTVIEADLLFQSDHELRQLVRGCDAVISCLGHVVSLKGVFGPPRDLVTRATRRLCQAIEASQSAAPAKFVLMSSVSVNQPEGRDTRRGSLEKVVLSAMRTLVPPAGDNQRAADFLSREVGTASTSVRWVAVRPDTLIEGDVSDYDAHEDLVSSLFRPDKTNMANVAHFMCELVTSEDAWRAWDGTLPVVVNAATT